LGASPRPPQPRIDVNRIVGETARAAFGLSTGLDLLDLLDDPLGDLDLGRLDDWLEQIDDGIETLRTLRKKLQEARKDRCAPEVVQ
jgi:hypothetical protein